MEITSGEMVPLLEITDHPFFTGLVNPGEACCALPASLPFMLGIDPLYSIPRMVMTEQIRTALRDAYSAGSMASTPLGESPLAAVRMNEFLGMLLTLSGGDIAGKKLLEIGCGNGELLNQLKLRGANVTGLEIGPQAQVVEERYGIRVLREPLAADIPKEKYDCIFSYGCLEHIEDLADFFAASRTHLDDSGLFLHSVPNSALFFERLSLDHLLHEHINYFTPANGVALLEAQGFSRAGSALTTAGNELMLWGYRDATKMPGWPLERISEETAFLKDYARMLHRKIKLTLDALKQIMSLGQSMAFYAGGFEYGFHLKTGAIRYFDGDVYKHGKQWLSGLPAIEPPEALLSRPVDRLVICKPHYFHPIRNALSRLGIEERCMVDIDSLSSGGA